MTPISGAEFERRLRRTSQLRAVCLRLKRAALEQWRQGRFPVRPKMDIRSDVEYWRARAAGAATVTDVAATVIASQPAIGPGVSSETSHEGAKP